MNPQSNRIELSYLLEVGDGNPNGDPDADNMPRVIPSTGQGWVSDVCIKRKIRNYVMQKFSNQFPYGIFIQEGAVLNNILQENSELLGVVADKQEEEDENGKKKSKGDKGKRTGSSVDVRKERMLSDYYDVRTFGAVMTTGNYSSGTVRGPVQVMMGRSIDVIQPMQITITRCCLTTPEDAKKKDNTMGKKWIIPYALYRVNICIMPVYALKTGFSEDDLSLLLEALENMWQDDMAAARGLVSPVALVSWTHQSQYGQLHTHKVFGSLTIKKKTGIEIANSLDDYEIKLNDCGVESKVHFANCELT
jgi:CRISPR-associated protein Csd2